MTHNYSLTGMTCSSCEAKVKSKLLSVPDVLSVDVSKDTNTATIEMQKHISLSTFQTAIGGSDSKYQIAAPHHNETAEQTKSWLATYKPILLIFGYISVLSLLLSWTGNSINSMQFMQVFMSGFFLIFSFFKLLDLHGFAESYSMYDLVAKRFRSWGYIYPFVELALGIAFAINFNPVLTNWITLVVMGVSIIGVLQSVLNKRKIRCACLGAVFNLP
ncbi:MAG: heavy-metal-associated domain-containing protein, partial [Chitinophagaceae bacterium]|nr:heavy-metal-associated domain-containing protein [Chitinophagaceae bacterium]